MASSNPLSFPVRLDVVGLSTGAANSGTTDPASIGLHALLGLGASVPLLVDSCTDLNLANGCNVGVIYSRLARLLAFCHEGLGTTYAAAFVNFNPSTVNRLTNEASEINLGSAYDASVEAINALLFLLAPDTALVYVNSAGIIGGGAGVLVPWDVKFVDPSGTLLALLGAGLGGLMHNQAQVNACRHLAQIVYTWLHSLTPSVKTYNVEVVAGAYLDGFFMSRIVTPNGGNQVDRVLGVRPIITTSNGIEILALSKWCQKPQVTDQDYRTIPDARVLISTARLAVEHCFIAQDKMSYYHLTMGTSSVDYFMAAIATLMVQHHGGHPLFLGGMLQHTFPVSFSPDELMIRSANNVLSVTISGASNTRNILLWNFVSMAIGGAAAVQSLLNGIAIGNAQYGLVSFRILSGQMNPGPHFTNRYVNPFLAAVAMRNANVDSGMMRVTNVNFAATKYSAVARTMSEAAPHVSKCLQAFWTDTDSAFTYSGARPLALCSIGGTQGQKPKKVKPANPAPAMGADLPQANQ